MRKNRRRVAIMEITAPIPPQRRAVGIDVFLFGGNSGRAVLPGIWRLSLWLGILGRVGRSGWIRRLGILWRAGLGRSAGILRIGVLAGLAWALWIGHAKAPF